MVECLKLLEFFLYGFFVTLVISPLVISLIKREKVKQVILHYVDNHKLKDGTPTMGGVIFILSICLVSFICFSSQNRFAKMILLIFFAYGTVGFLDDFIKFKFKRNLGLTAFQKISFQLLVSVGVGFYIYNNIGGVILIPFLNIYINLGIWIIPFISVVYLACSNSVNLTDGLDGLATSTSLICLISFFILELILFSKGIIFSNIALYDEMWNIFVIVCVASGALLCFLIFNCFPAKIFMGDTGSLSLGSLIASVSIFSGLELYLPILGLIFVVSSVSVIMQVAYYKLTKKRIFLMAPLHHHFERKGVHEVRITFVYSLISLLIGVVVILLNIL